MMDTVGVTILFAEVEAEKAWEAKKQKLWRNLKNLLRRGDVVNLQTKKKKKLVGFKVISVIFFTKKMKCLKKFVSREFWLDVALV